MRQSYIPSALRSDRVNSFMQKFADVLIYVILLNFKGGEEFCFNSQVYNSESADCMKELK